MKPEINTFEIILSNECNLECKYCYVCQTPETMSTSNIDKVISWIEQYPNKSYDYMIHFFGGEPLCHKDLIKYFIEHSSFTNEFLIFTNATLFTEEFLNWSVKYSNINFNISLDGYKLAHNANRIFHNGQGSFDLIQEKLNLYRKIYHINRPIWVKSVITENNIQYLKNTLENLPKLNAYLSYSIDHSRHWSKEEIEKFKFYLNEAADYYIENFKKLPYTNLFLTPVDSYGNYYSKICNGTEGKQFTINYDLNCYPCAHFIGTDLTYGHLDNVQQEETLEKMKILNKNSLPACKECTYFKYNNCLYGCPAAVYKETKDFTTNWPDRCEILKIYTEISLRVYKNLQFDKQYQNFLRKKSYDSIY